MKEQFPKERVWSNHSEVKDFADRLGIGEIYYSRIAGLWKNHYFTKAMGQWISQNHIKIGGETAFRMDWKVNTFYVGKTMEETAILLKAINAEVEESKKTLEDLNNKIHSLSEVVQPALVEHIKQLRANRMSCVNEIREFIGSLTEIRKFFLESDYEREVERLERFVSLCKELKALRDDGTLEAVSNTAIRLAIKEESK